MRGMTECPVARNSRGRMLRRKTSDVGSNLGRIEVSKARSSDAKDRKGGGLRMGSEPLSHQQGSREVGLPQDSEFSVALAYPGFYFGV